MGFRLHLFLGLLVLVLVSCAGPYSKEQLYGKWKVEKWEVEQSGKIINRKMDFSFNTDKRYSVDYGSMKEQGEYWIVDEYLHTIAEGKSEKSVKILKLNADTLTFQMNRSGVLEQVLFVRP